MPEFRPHVLIVDDTAALRRQIRWEFEPLDVTIEEAVDGVDALKKARQKRPDLITLDVEMPRMDGHGVCRALTAHESTFGIPVIMVSGLESESARLQALESGAIDYFIKPFSPGTLRQLAEELFAAQAQNRARTIFALDQDPAVVLRLQDMLTKHGYKYRGFNSVDSLLETICRDTCDLLLLDFQLPAQGSQRVVEQLRCFEHAKQTRIVACTAPDGRRQLARAFNAGASDFVVKPFYVEELVARIDRQFKLQKQEGELRELATVDPLTRLPNRGELNRRSSVEVLRAIRNRETLGVAMIDVDHFKLVNDTYGHAGGDQVLRAIGAVLEGSVRATDVVGRFGGEELVVLLPRSTAQGLLLVLERLRRRVEKLRIETESGVVRVTISVGAQLWRWDSLSTNLELPELLSGADEALYEAKRNGRNRVIVAPCDSERSPAVDQSGEPASSVRHAM